LKDGSYNGERENVDFFFTPMEVSVSEREPVKGKKVLFGFDVCLNICVKTKKNNSPKVRMHRAPASLSRVAFRDALRNHTHTHTHAGFHRLHGPVKLTAV